jgi:hypothetical protein
MCMTFGQARKKILKRFKDTPVVIGSGSIDTDVNRQEGPHADWQKAVVIPLLANPACSIVTVR